MKGFVLGLALKQRRKATRKSPILFPRQLLFFHFFLSFFLSCIHLVPGEAAVPCQPNVSCTSVFEYVVHNATQYNLKTLKMKGLGRSARPEYVVLGNEGVFAQARFSENRPRGKLSDNKKYDITFVVSLKDSFEGGVVHLEYFVLMTSRRELYPKLIMDLWQRRVTAPPRACSFGEEGNARDYIRVPSDKGLFTGI